MSHEREHDDSAREAQWYRHQRFILISKLLAIIAFLTGGIVCTMLKEDKISMLLLGSSATSFSTLFSAPTAPPPPKDSSGGGSNNSSGGGGGGGGGSGPRVPGSGVTERVRGQTDRSIIKGQGILMEYLVIMLLFLIGLTLNLSGSGS